MKIDLNADLAVVRKLIKFINHKNDTNYEVTDIKSINFRTFDIYVEFKDNNSFGCVYTINYAY